jgi:hypothetical protein
MLRDYMTVLNILMQNPTARFDDVVGNCVTLKTDKSIDESTSDTEVEAKSNDNQSRRYTAQDIEF